LRHFTHRKHDNIRVYNAQGESTFNDVAMSVLRIYAVVENRQADHQASMVELEGIITEQPITILVDPGSIISYVSL
jgi:hypothetical protein